MADKQEQYKKLVTESCDRALKLIKEVEGWVQQYDQEGTKGWKKDVEGVSVSCFKATTKLPLDAKKTIDTLWGLTHKEWNTDGNIETWEIKEQVNDTLRIVYQVNKLSWPIWNRDVCTVQSLIEVEGGHMMLTVSCEHDSCPEQPKKLVRAKVVVNVYYLVPDGEGCVAHRVALIDPAVSCIQEHKDNQLNFTYMEVKTSHPFLSKTFAPHIFEDFEWRQVLISTLGNIPSVVVNSRAKTSVFEFGKFLTKFAPK